MADCLGFVNHWVYLQILRFQRARAEKSLANLEEFCTSVEDQNGQVGRHLTQRRAINEDIKSLVGACSEKLQQVIISAEAG